jgi:hypothetical protein
VLRPCQEAARRFDGQCVIWLNERGCFDCAHLQLEEWPFGSEFQSWAQGRQSLAGAVMAVMRAGRGLPKSV